MFLDISASHEGRAIMLEMVRRVAEQIFMPFTVGGGIRTLEDATQLIQAGAEKVSLNSAAVKTPELIAQVGRKFGSCATVVNIDPRRVSRDGREVMGSPRERRPRADRAGSASRGRSAWWNLGAGEIVLTSMDADGTKNGYDMPMLEAVTRAVNVPVVASGGGRQPRAPAAGVRSRSRRGAGREHLPLQRVLDSRHQGVPRRERGSRSRRLTSAVLVRS